VVKTKSNHPQHHAIQQGAQHHEKQSRTHAQHLKSPASRNSRQSSVATQIANMISQDFLQSFDDFFAARYNGATFLFFIKVTENDLHIIYCEMKVMTFLYKSDWSGIELMGIVDSIDEKNKKVTGKFGEVSLEGHGKVITENKILPMIDPYISCETVGISMRTITFDNAKIVSGETPVEIGYKKSSIKNMSSPYNYIDNSVKKIMRDHNYKDGFSVMDTRGTPTDVWWEKIGIKGSCRPEPS